MLNIVVRNLLGKVVNMSEKETVVKCSKCDTRMVKQSDVYVLARFERQSSGAVNFSLADDITTRVYVCPKCRRMELFYERV